MIAPAPVEAAQIARAATIQTAEVPAAQIGSIRCRRLARAYTSCLVPVTPGQDWHVFVGRLADGSYDVFGHALRS